jgi:hypothetical protein
MRVSLRRANADPKAAIVSLSIPAVHLPTLNLKWIWFKRMTTSEILCKSTHTPKPVSCNNVRD